jgi:ribokinase
MKVDVACLGDPYLDLIFLGLDALPVPGEERLATGLKIVAGGMANVAFALERLGLDAVVCAPIGRDRAGRVLGELMADAGVAWIGRDSDVTPVSVALPVGGERAFVSVSAPPAVDLETLSTLDARAIVVDLPSAPLVAGRDRVYAVVGDPEVGVMVSRLPPSLGDLRALILNERELRAITRERDVEAAATRLAALGTTVVVTLGPRGAMATEPDGAIVTADAAGLISVDDTTGAGDLFAAAFAWADLGGADPETSLAWANLYAGLSVSAHTGVGGAVERERLVEEGEQRGLAPLPA